MVERRIPLWKPKWSDPCPCASEKKFKDCCRRRLPGFDIGKAYFKAIKEQQLDRALIHARADITQYTIWHRTNTAPLLTRAGFPMRMLRIDVNALGEYIGRLSSLHFRLNLWGAWLAALDRLRGNIDHPLWWRKVGYYRALYHLAPNGDRVEARREVAKLQPITTAESDLELLQLFLDVESDRLSFADRMSFLDRILELSDERDNQVQYRCAKAIQYYLIGDQKAAEEQARGVIQLFRDTQDEDPIKGRERWLFASTLQLLGAIGQDKEILAEAASEFQLLIAEDGWTDAGKAKMLRDLGDTYRYQGEWDLAERVFRDAVAISGPGLDQVHIAECMLGRGKSSLAVEEIKKTDLSLLRGRETEDYAFSFASIALASRESEMLPRAVEILKNLPPLEPIFNTQRLEFLLKINEALNASREGYAVPANHTATFANFLLLQPNIIGFGINFNAIIDSLGRRKPKDNKSKHR